MTPVPPLWQYFLRLQKKADESIPAPKGRGSWTPKPFPLQIDSFLGTATGAIIAILDPWLADASMGGRRPCPRSGSTSRVRQNDDIGNLEQPEARLDQPAALPLFMPLPPRWHGKGLAVRIDGSPRALLQFDRNLEFSPPEVLLRLRKACADATGCYSRSWNTHCLGACGPDSGRTTHAGSKDRGVATVRTRPRRPHDVVSLVH
jgi:hypothetical protein